MIDSLFPLFASGQLAGKGGLLSLGIVCFVGALAFIPRTPICILGGLMFGLAAFPVALVGSTFGAVVAFLLSRYLFRSHVFRIVDRRPALRVIVDAIDAEGWRLLGLLRLASPVPGSASNYLFGLTGIGMFPYVTATLLGSAPQVLAFVYLGAASRLALGPDSISTAKLLFALAGCIVTLAAVYITARRIKSLLAVRLACRTGSGT
jgi:uncharacterized membrane protein YdjX (TVP38/TMEM64 family)